MISDEGRMRNILFVNEGGGDWCVVTWERRDKTLFRTVHEPGIEPKKGRYYDIVGNLEEDPYGIFGNWIRNPTLTKK